MCHASSTGERLTVLAPQEGFVKQLLPSGWLVWLVTAAGVRALASRAAWEAADSQVCLPDCHAHRACYRFTQLNADANNGIG